MRYRKDTPRVNIIFINDNTEEVLLEIDNRTWMDMGQLFSDGNIDNVMKNELKGKTLPKNIRVIADCTATLQ